jgi:hypothetical protein
MMGSTNMKVLEEIIEELLKRKVEFVIHFKNKSYAIVEITKGEIPNNISGFKVIKDGDSVRVVRFVSIMERDKF